MRCSESSESKMSGSRSAKLVALGQAAAKEKEEYKQPESPCPPIHPRAFKRFRETVFESNKPEQQKRAKRDSLGGVSDGAEGSHLLPDLRPPAEKDNSLSKTIKTTSSNVLVDILVKDGGPPITGKDISEESNLKHTRANATAEFSNDSPVIHDSYLNSSDSKIKGTDPVNCNNSNERLIPVMDMHIPIMLLDKEEHSCSVIQKESETHECSGSPLAPLPAKDSDITQGEDTSSIATIIGTSNGQVTPSSGEMLFKKSDVTEPDFLDSSIVCSTIQFLKESVDSNNNNELMPKSSCYDKSLLSIPEETTPVNHQVSPTENGLSFVFPPKLCVAIQRDKVLTPTIIGTARHKKTANKEPGHISAKRELFKENGPNVMNDIAGFEPFSDDSDGLKVDSLCNINYVKSIAKDSTSYELVSKSEEHSLTLPTSQLLAAEKSFINGCSVDTSRLQEDITSDITNNEEIHTIEIPEILEIPDVVTDELLLHHLDITNDGDIANKAQNVLDCEDVMSNENSLIEPVVSTDNASLSSSHSQGMHDKPLVSGDSEVIFTDESNVVLNDTEISSLNFADVMIIPLDEPVDAGVLDVDATPQGGDIPLQEPIQRGDDNVINAEALAVLEEGREAPLPARQRKPDSWKRNVVRNLKNAGQAHTSLRGHDVKAAAIGPRCGKTCRRNCQDVSNSDREKIFNTYYKLCDRSAKWRFISGYVRAVDIKKRTVVVHDIAEAKKKSSYEYYLPLANQSDIQVCQTMFINTLGITAQSVKTAIKKRTDKFGLVSPSKMGKSEKQKAVDKAREERVTKHIKSFPTVESHYCRKNSTFRYIDEKLNRRNMHSMYVLECQGKNMQKNEIAPLKTYRRIFKRYKLKFYKPKKDQCPKCLSWKNKSHLNRTPEGAEKMRVHLSQKELSYQLKNADTEFVKSAENRKDLCVMTCDLQKTMSTPKGENGEFYYKSKFTTYNFTVFVSGEQQGYCYTWDQTTGKKGCTEITSCMWKFIQLQVEKGITEIRIYSDNCSAQNKNQYLFSMYVMASIRFNIKIVHRYLESGHTLLQCDAMHARIENSMKNKDVFSPSEWITAMRMAKIKNPKYIVKVMEQADLYDFNPLASYQGWNKIKTSQIREVIICGEEPGKIKYKFLFDTESEEVQIINPKRGRPVVWSTFQLKKKYQKKFPVRPDILKGLQDLCKSGAIPEEHAPFYLEYLPSISAEAEQVEDAPASEVSDVESEDDSVSDSADSGNEDEDE